MPNRDAPFQAFVPELVRMGWRNPLSAVTRGARIHAAFLEVVAESVGQQSRLAQDLTKRWIDTWTRLCAAATSDREARP